MNYFKKCRMCVYLSIITCLIGSGATFFVVRATDIANHQENDVPMYIVGGVFWAGLLLTYLLVLLASVFRKKALQLGYGVEQGLYDTDEESKVKRPGRIGMFSFFRNKEATITDVIMVCSMLLAIGELLFGVDTGIIVLISIFLTIFSVHMHGILNGKNYYYLRVSKDI